MRCSLARRSRRSFVVEAFFPLSAGRNTRLSFTAAVFSSRSLGCSLVVVLLLSFLLTRLSSLSHAPPRSLPCSLPRHRRRVDR